MSVDDRAPELVVADGWFLDELARTRLEVQLDRAPGEVVGIAACPAPLEPGESLVHRAATAARAPLDALAPTAGPVEGAVLLRAGTPHEVDGDRIEVDAAPGTLLVDRGAHVHDPWQPVDPLAPVGTDVRPPFPHRAVVLFLGIGADVDVADWARGMANDLLRHGVDARMAVTEPTEGLHLTRPCRTGPEVVAAVAPHVVIPLDDDATEALEGWWGDDRTRLVVAYEPDALVGAEPISWRIGAAQGRLRGRVGQAARGADLAVLIDRLCGGPHPLPPPDAVDAPTGRDLRSGVSAVVSSIRSRRATDDDGPRRRSIRLWHDDGPVEPWLDGLLDALVTAGHDVQRKPLTDRATRVDAGDVVVLHRTPASDALLAAIDVRRAAGRPTLLAAGPTSASEPGTLLPDADRLLRACGHVVTPAPSLARAIDEQAAEHLVVPPLLAQHHVAELRSLRAAPRAVADGPRALGWQLDRGAPAEQVAAIAAALAVVLGEEPDAELVLVAPGGTDAVPPELVRRASVLDERPGPWVVKGWTAQIWSSSTDEYDRTGDVTPLVEASALAVPTLLAGDHPALRAVPHPRPLRVRPGAEPDAWTTAVRPVLADLGARARRSADVVAVVDALFGPASRHAVADRFLGWVDTFAAEPAPAREVTGA